MEEASEEEFPLPPDSKQHEQEHGLPSEHEEEPVFSESDIQNLQDIFSLFDKDKQGSIEASDLEAILTSLKRDPDEARDMLAKAEQEGGKISFDQFVDLMAKIERKIER
jgi:Ca2+-binding EF-hand superfamily protein